MVQIVSAKYKLDKNENLGPYLKSLGVPDEVIQKAEKPGLTLDVVVEGDKISFNSSSGLGISFNFNVEFDEPMPGGIILKTTAKKEGDNKIILSSTAPDGRTGTRTYEFTDSGVTQILVTGGVTAKRYYSKA